MRGIKHRENLSVSLSGRTGKSSSIGGRQVVVEWSPQEKQSDDTDQVAQRLTMWPDALSEDLWDDGHTPPISTIISQPSGCSNASHRPCHPYRQAGSDGRSCHTHASQAVPYNLCRNHLAT